MQVHADSVMPNTHKTMTCCRVETICGDKIRADPHGKNVAFECLDDECKHPVIATIGPVAVRGDKEFNSSKPAICRGCGWKYWIEVYPEAKTVKVLRIQSDYK